MISCFDFSLHPFLTLKISTLGELSVVQNDKKLTLIKSKRTRALLAYLATSKRPQRRENICEYLWDDHNDPKGALRWSLSKIRKFVNEKDIVRLIANRERVMLLTNDIIVDIEQIITRLKQSQLDIDELKEYLSLLENSFLEGLDIPSQAKYQRWLIAKRLETAQLYLRVLKRLWEHINTTPEQKLQYIKIGISKEPYNLEVCHQLLIQLKLLGLSEEYDASESDIKQRFRNAGIKWQEFEFTQTNNEAKFIETVTSHDFLTRQQVRFCRTNDNTRIAYASVGEGYPIVKTANWLTHLEYDWNAPIWSPLFRALASKHKIIRYDERGNGLSDWTVKDLSFNAFVDDLETVVNETKLEKFALLGISQGASVSIEYTINNPDKVSHLILFGAYVAGWKIDTSPEEIKRREAIITLTEAGWGQDNPAYRQIFSSTFMPSANKEELDWFNEFQRQTTSPENAARFLTVFGDIDVRHQLAKINVPTLVIHSLGDQRIPLHVGQDIAAQIPNAEFIGLQSDGHLLLGREAASAIFVETVKDFIARNP